MEMDTKKRRKEIGAHLQKARKGAGFKSAKSFAEYAGLNPNTYTQYEQGIVGMSYERAWKIADALDCTLDALGGRNPPKRAYDDQRQEALNGYYESMNDGGQQLLAETAKSMSADPERRIVKDRPERAYGQTAMGA